MDGPLVNPVQESGRRGVYFLRALRGALSRPTVWLFVWLVTSLLSSAPAYPVFGFYRNAIGHRYEPGSLVHSPDRTLLSESSDTSFRVDHGDELGALNETVGRVGAVVAILMLLWGAFSAGGWLQVVLQQAKSHPMRRFIFGGARYFWRFFRLLMLTLVIVGAFGWVVYEWPWKEYVLAREFAVPDFDLEQLETLESEWTVVQLSWLQATVFGLFFVLTLTWADYVRTRLALHDTSSVLGAGLRTFFTMLRHPVRTLRPMVLLVLVELLVILGGFWLRQRLEQGLIDDPTTTRWLGAVLVGQFVVLWRVITRGARYHAAVLVSRDVVRPISRPDPWKSIGGPGGPRYPLEDADEYGVSL